MRVPILTLLLGVGLQCACAQEISDLPRTVFRFAPQNFINNSLKVGMERFNKVHSASFLVHLSGRLQAEQRWIDSYNGLGGELALRRYITPMTLTKGKKNHWGIYGSLYVQGGSYSGDITYYDGHRDPATGNWVSTEYRFTENIGVWGGGFTFGYQRTFWEVIFLDVYIGGGLQGSDIIRTGQLPPDPNFYSDIFSDPGYRGVIPKMGIHFGLGL